ncbi:MAG: FAD-dependent oxidoreductase, partial [Paucibacter sp.]|nr:FAD-dependent oxidoreductase [Roseateles sp.]
MRIGIVGAGMVGVATALELALDGHEVRVFDRHGGVASESSFAHAGIVSAALQAPGGGLTPLSPHQGLGHSATQRWTPRHLGWLLNARRVRRLGNLEQAARDMQALTHLSQERMRSLRHQFQLDHERTEGLLVL